MVKKWVRNQAWERQPHVKAGPPPSLWWYRRPDRYRVIDAYIDQCKRGRTLPEGFKDDLVKWLQDLSELQNLKALGRPRTFRYWSLPAYALAEGRKNPKTFCKRFRELEKIAKRLFPDSVPSSRKPRAPLSDAEKKEIRQLYLDGVDAKELAQRFRIASSKVGHLCREQKSIRDAERDKAQSETGPAPAPDIPDEMPF